jgi:hypothetical protein
VDDDRAELADVRLDLRSRAAAGSVHAAVCNKSGSEHRAPTGAAARFLRDLSLVRMLL